MTATPLVNPNQEQSSFPNWRLTPGYIEDSGSDVESVHILLGRFLTDRDSADPLPEKELFSEDGKFEWGYARPLEKTITSESDLNFLAQNPNLYRNAITIIEPWEHVGNNGRVVAQGWYDDNFAVVLNEEKEVGDRIFLPYKTPNQKDCSIPIELLNTHEVMADELEGVIDDAILRYENDINIAMFHSDEVNEEAILFANWAYMTLHNAIVPHRYTVAASPLSWLLQMPYAVEILASTEANGEILTECSCTCINYKDFETKKIRRSFTCQFHPELLSDLRDIGKRPAPSYAELKQSDGMRLLARLLYEGMQE